MAEFVPRAIQTTANTTNVADALPSKTLASNFIKLFPSSQNTTLKLTITIPTIDKALATSIPIILEFIDIGCNDKCFQYNLIHLGSQLHLKKCLVATLNNRGSK